MSRKTTTIGKGAFGRGIPKDYHEWDVVRRIIDNRLPLTEDAVFILMSQILKRNNSIILKAVRGSKNIGRYQYFYFTPDIDLLEVRKNEIIVGYEHTA